VFYDIHYPRLNEQRSCFHLPNINDDVALTSPYITVEVKTTRSASSLTKYTLDNLSKL